MHTKNRNRSLKPSQTGKLVGVDVPRLVGLAIAVTPALGEPAKSLEYINCGSGQDYGICRACGRGHGHVIFRRANS